MKIKQKIIDELGLNEIDMENLQTLPKELKIQYLQLCFSDKDMRLPSNMDDLFEPSYKTSREKKALKELKKQDEVRLTTNYYASPAATARWTVGNMDEAETITMDDIDYTPTFRWTQTIGGR